MEVLDGFDVPGAGRVELCAGDLTAMRGDDAVDLLVVSAFRDNYQPTTTSLIGALARVGVSVEALAKDKASDLRPTSSCWLSKALPEGKTTVGFDQILCYEPETPVASGETIGDVFRALVPFVSPGNVEAVAMPILATGHQAQSIELMLGAILEAATAWMGMRLPLRRLRVVVLPPAAPSALAAWRQRRSSGVTPDPLEIEDVDRPYDAFVSYARSDGADVAEQLIGLLQTIKPNLKVFLDSKEIDTGSSWQQAIYDCLNDCRKVVALITPGFLQSKVCEEELNIARLRDRNNDGNVLVPLYVKSADLEKKAHISILNYADCREADAERLRAACSNLASQL